MCKKCLFVFLAGAMAFHALSHIVLIFTPLLPLTVWGITLTQSLNYLIITGSIALSALFLYAARQNPCMCTVAR